MPELINFGYENKEVATHDELLDFCNKVRKAGGGEILGSLLPGYTGNSQTCLIAKNLNFQCSVVPFYKMVEGKEVKQANKWVMSIHDEYVLYRVAEEVELTVDVRIKGSEFEVCLILPEHIGNAADAFDRELAFTDLDVQRKNSLVLLEKGQNPSLINLYKRRE